MVSSFTLFVVSFLPVISLGVVYAIVNAVCSSEWLAGLAVLINKQIRM